MRLSHIGLMGVLVLVGQPASAEGDWKTLRGTASLVEAGDESRGLAMTSPSGQRVRLQIPGRMELRTAAGVFATQRYVARGPVKRVRGVLKMKVMELEVLTPPATGPWERLRLRRVQWRGVEARIEPNPDSDPRVAGELLVFRHQNRDYPSAGRSQVSDVVWRDVHASGQPKLYGLRGWLVTARYRETASTPARGMINQAGLRPPTTRLFVAQLGAESQNQPVWITGVMSGGKQVTFKRGSQSFLGPIANLRIGERPEPSPGANLVDKLEQNTTVGQDSWPVLEVTVHGAPRAMSAQVSLTEQLPPRQTRNVDSVLADGQTFRLRFPAVGPAVLYMRIRSGSSVRVFERRIILEQGGGSLRLSWGPDAPLGN